MAARTLVLLLAALLAACSGSETPPTQPPPPPEEFVPAEVTAWLQANAIPFTTSQAGGSYQDLLPLKAVVGDARIVSLGEATHGTREFFEMKHRLFEFLVREMGFTVFAIESEWAEAARIDEYVRTGRGDAQALLTGLYFWTWRTREVLELIDWMRGYNANPANPNKVSFVGVDAQFPTLAMDTVVAFLRRVDPQDAALAEERYACLRPYSNDARGVTQTPYDQASPVVQQQCRAQVQQVHDHLAANRARLEAATSAADYAFALRAARLAVQGEDVRAERDGWARDRYMAENAEWWLDRAGAGAKMVIWAHNAHVSTAPQWMGYQLRARHGAAMRVMGFSFYQGSFTAVNLDGGPFGTYTFGPPPEHSYEAVFHTAGLPRFILDLRAGAATSGGAWLAGPLAVREIGCCHRPSIPSWGVRTASLPALYDVIIHFENTTASQTIAPRWP